jgi:ATP synthase protein I
MAQPRKSKGQTAQDDPAGMGDLTERLKDLSGRIEAEKAEYAESRKLPESSMGDASGYAKGYRLVSEFVAGTLVGGLIGYGLDHLFGTMPILFIVFLLLGFGAGILNMARAANREPPAQDRSGTNPPSPAALDDEEED